MFPAGDAIIKTRFRQEPSAFALIELLVVVAVIAILAALLLPAFSAVREKAPGGVHE